MTMNASIFHRMAAPARLAAALLLLVLAAPPVQAQPARGPAPPAAPAAVAATSHVSSAGSLDKGEEKVDIAGPLSITSRVIQDLDFRNPDVLELIIDFGEVRGQGKASRQAYGSDAVVIVRRPLLPRDEFEVSFPVTPGRNPNAARTVAATIEVNTEAGGRVSFRQARLRDFDPQ